MSCAPQIKSIAQVLTILNPDGTPSILTTDRYVSNALVTLDVSVERQEGEEFSFENAASEIGCGSWKDPDQYKWLSLSMTVCTPDPVLMAILTRSDTLDVTGFTTQGWAFPELNKFIGADGISYEFYRERILPGVGLHPDAPYARWLLPKAQFWHDSANVGRSNLQPEFVGRAFENPNWASPNTGTGPNSDWPTGVPSGRAIQWIPASSAPEPTCNPAG